MSHLSSCSRCQKGLDSVSYIVVYDKCRGKTCPDCGKVRKMGWYQIISAKSSNFINPCVKCKRDTNYWIDKLCSRCFLERERKRGCVCFQTSGYDKNKGHHDNVYYYCPLCEDVHPRESLCKECFEKQIDSYQSEQIFLKVVLSTMIISLIIGFFLGWLFLVKLRKKKSKINISFQ